MLIQQGLNLTAVIENFLVRFIGSSKNATEQAVPDIVLSLLGAGESVADEDINAREAKDVFARFSSDWGGDMSTEDYADMLRSGNLKHQAF